MGRREPEVSNVPHPVRNAFLFVSLALSLFACNPSGEQKPPTEAAPAATVEMVTEQAATPTLPGSASPTITLPAPTAMPSIEPTITPLPSPTSSPQPTPCAETAGSVEYGLFNSAVAGGEQAYSVYLPPCYEARGPAYPVVYLFAGNIHDERKWLELGLNQVADEAIVRGELAPFVVVMPDGGWLANNTSGGPGSYESLVLDELIPYVESEYCVWPVAAGRAIGGLSRGGYWALEIAFRFPDRFASVGGHSAALLDTYAGPDVNPQHTALSRDLDGLRIYLDIGSEDYVRANTIRLHEEMQAAGVAHDWRLNSGRHEDAYWAAQVSDYLQWYASPWPRERDTYPACNPQTLGG